MANMLQQTGTNKSRGRDNWIVKAEGNESDVDERWCELAEGEQTDGVVVVVDGRCEACGVTRLSWRNGRPTVIKWPNLSFAPLCPCFKEMRPFKHLYKCDKASGHIAA